MHTACTPFHCEHPTLSAIPAHLSTWRRSPFISLISGGPLSTELQELGAPPDAMPAGTQPISASKSAGGSERHEDPESTMAIAWPEGAPRRRAWARARRPRRALAGSFLLRPPRPRRRGWGAGSLAASGGSGVQYFLGTWNGSHFESLSPPNSARWLDVGRDNYAAFFATVLTATATCARQARTERRRRAALRRLH